VLVDFGLAVFCFDLLEVGVDMCRCLHGLVLIRCDFGSCHTVQKFDRVIRVKSPGGILVLMSKMFRWIWDLLLSPSLVVPAKIVVRTPAGFN